MWSGRVWTGAQRTTALMALRPRATFTSKNHMNLKESSAAMDSIAHAAGVTKSATQKKLESVGWTKRWSSKL